MEWVNFWATSGALTIVGGGVSGALMASLLQRRTIRMDRTYRLFEEFSKMEAHRARRSFWLLVESLPPGSSLANAEHKALEADQNGSKGELPDQLPSFRHVLGYFSSAGRMMDLGLIDRGTFFALTERWMHEIAVRHLFEMAKSELIAKNHVEHVHGLSSLAKHWTRWAEQKSVRATNPITAL